MFAGVGRQLGTRSNTAVDGERISPTQSGATGGTAGLAGAASVSAASRDVGDEDVTAEVQLG